MAKLFFNENAEGDPIQQFKNEIKKLEQSMAQIKGFDHWLSEFGRLKAELAEKRARMDVLRKNLLSTDPVGDPSAFKALQQEAAQVGLEQDALVEATAAAGDEFGKSYEALNTSFEEIQSAANGVDMALIDQRARVAGLQADISTMSEIIPGDEEAAFRMSEKEQELAQEAVTLGQMEATREEAQFAMKTLDAEVQGYENVAEEVSGTEAKTNMGLERMKKLVSDIGGFDTFKKLASDVVRVREEFEKTQIAFETLLGSKSGADALMSQISQTASWAPFDLENIMGGAQQLLAYGVEGTEVNDTLIRLGNLASGLSVPLGDMVSLYGSTLMQGSLFSQDAEQYMSRGIPLAEELANMFGKTEEEVMQMVDAGKVGFPAVEQAIKNMTDQGGQFHDLMGVQSETLSGQITTLGNAWDQMLNSVGEDTEGLTSGVLSMATSAVQNYELLGKTLMGLVATYGSYKAAVMLLTAIESKHTLSEIALTNVKVGLRKVTMALNASMLTNPYVAMAVAVGALITVSLTLLDSERQLKDVQESYNKKLDEAIQKEQERKKRIDALLEVAGSENAATEDRKKALVGLVQAYPSIFGKYATEEEMLKNILNIKKEIAEYEYDRSASNPRNQLKDVRKKIEDLEKLANERYHGGRGLTQAENVNLSFLKKQEKQLTGQIQKENANKALSNLSGYSNRALEAEIKARQQLLDKMKLSGSKKGTMSSSLASGTFSGKELSGQIKLIQAELAKREQLLEKGNSIDDQSDKGGKKSVSPPAPPAPPAQESIEEQRSKVSDMEERQRSERERMDKDLDSRLAQSDIDANPDEKEKARAQRELDHKKEIEDLERQKEEYIQALVKSEEDIFNAKEDLAAREDPKHERKVFDADSVSKDASGKWDAIINNAKKEQTNEQAKEETGRIKEEEAAMTEHLIKYGDYYQKRIGIFKKYNAAIDSAKTDAEKASLTKERDNEIDELDNSVKDSTTLMGQLFADASEKSVGEIQKIIDHAKLLVEYVKAEKDKNGDAQIGGKTVSKQQVLNLGVSENTLDNLNTTPGLVDKVGESTDKMAGKLGSQSPFLLFKKQIGDAVEQLKKGNIAQGIQGLGNAITQFSPAVSKFGNDLGTIFGDDDIGKTVSGVMDAVAGVGQTAAGVGQIMAGDIVGGTMSAVSGISSVFSALDGLFGADYSHYNEMKEQYDILSTVWDQLIDKKMEYLKISYGDEADKVGKEAEALAQKGIDSNRVLGREYLDSGAGLFSSSRGVKMRKNMSDEGFNQARAVLGSEFDAHGIGDGRMTGLFDLSAKQLEELKSDAPLFWAKLDDEVRGYLNNVIDGAEKIEAIQKATKEQLTQVSFDSVFDSFVDTLMNMDSSAEDFSKNFASYMQKAMLTTMIGETYRKDLQDWYDKFAEANKDEKGITEDEYKDLQKEYEDITAKAIEERNNLGKAMGWKEDSAVSSQETTRESGFQSMSQDTGDELNGRFTALQIAGDEIRNQSILQTESLNILGVKADLLLAVNSGIYNIADEMRTFQVNSYQELQVIRENTGAIVKPIKEMRQELAEIRNNIKNI